MTSFTGEHLALYKNKRVESIARIFHTTGTEVDQSEGGVEFRFSDNTVLYCESGSDGASLNIALNPWHDPFEGDLTQENIEFIEKSGKESRFDVSHHPRWADLIGGKLWDIAQITSLTGIVIGIVITISGRMLCVYTDSDETHVQFLGNSSLD